MAKDDRQSKSKFVQSELFTDDKTPDNETLLNDQLESANDVDEVQNSRNSSQEHLKNLDITQESNENDDDDETEELIDQDTTSNNIVISIKSDGESSIGEKLKSTRINQNRTISDIAQATRIRNDFIECIEENEFSKLPTAAIFTKSFIKSLCREYNLDSDDIVSEFEKIVNHSDAININSAPDSSHQKNIASLHETDTTVLRKRTSLKFAWIITLLIFCIAIITLTYVVKSRKSVNTPEILHLNTNTKFISEETLEQFLVPEQLELDELEIQNISGNGEKKTTGEKSHQD